MPMSTKSRFMNIPRLTTYSSSFVFDPEEATNRIIENISTDPQLQRMVSNVDGLAHLFATYLWHARETCLTLESTLEAKAPLCTLTMFLEELGVDRQRIKTAVCLAFTRVRTYLQNAEYFIAPGLFAQLQETKLTGVGCSDIHLPFDAIDVHFPEEMLTATHKVSGCTLHIPVIEGYRHLMIIAHTASLVDATQEYMLFQLELPENRPLDDMLSEYIQQNKSAGVITQAYQAIFNLVLNTIMYATWPDADILDEFANPQAKILWNKIQGIPPCKRRNRLQAMLDSMDTAKHKVLGSSIIYISRQQAEKEDTDLAQQTGKKLVLRIRVAGHWTNQAYGPGHSLRKRIWIQPYWKGPEDGFLKPQTRVLKMRNEAKVC